VATRSVVLKQEIRITRVQPGIYRIDAYRDGVRVSGVVERGSARDIAAEAKRVVAGTGVVVPWAGMRRARRGAGARRRRARP